MPSASQRNQLRSAQTIRSRGDISIEAAYQGRDLETGLSLIQTADGAVIPAHLEASAQPFLNESLFATQSNGISYALGRSIQPEEAPIIDFIPPGTQEKFSVIFSKGVIIPSLSMITDTAAIGRCPITLIIGSDGDTLTPTALTSTSFAGTNPSIGCTITYSQNNFTSTVNFASTNLTGGPEARTFSYVSIRLPVGITVEIDWTLSQSFTLSPIFVNSQTAEGFITIGDSPPPLSPDPLFIDGAQVTQVSQSINKTTLVTTGLTFNPFDFKYVSLFLQTRTLTAVSEPGPFSGTVTAVINSITLQGPMGSIWIGGDRDPVKLMDAVEGITNYLNFQTMSLAANQSNVFALLQDYPSISSGATRVFELQTQGTGLTQTNYVFGATIPSPNTWRDKWFTTEVDSSLITDTDSCVNDFGATTFNVLSQNNLVGIQPVNTLRFVDMSQMIDGDFLITRLQNLESVDDAVVAISDLDGTGVTCVEDTSPDDVEVDIMALAPITETESVRVLAGTAYIA